MADRDLQPGEEDLAVAAVRQLEGAVELREPRLRNGGRQTPEEMQPLVRAPVLGRERGRRRALRPGLDLAIDGGERLRMNRRDVGGQTRIEDPASHVDF